MSLTVAIELTSIWHVGTGMAGGGRTDAATARRGALAVLPASSLKGLARDRAPLVAAATGVDHTASVFGTAQVEGAWAFRPAAPRGEPDLSAAPRVVRHNRVDPLTGRVPTNAFFDFEVGRPAVLYAVVEPKAGTADPVVTAFLVACLASVERLGARRRRGWGSCRVRVVDGERDTTAEMLAPLFEARP